MLKTSNAVKPQTSYTGALQEEAYAVESTEPTQPSSVTDPTPDELVFAKRLEGTPKQFDLASTKLLQTLVRKGLAAEFGKDGYARGHAWDKYVR